MRKAEICTVLALSLWPGCTRKEPGTSAATKPARTEPAAEVAARGVAPVGIRVGEQAPDFELPDDAGQAVHLAGFLERRAALLAFYPKDFTSG